MLQYGKEMIKTCVFTDFYGQFQSEDEQQIFSSSLNRKARQRKTPALEGKCWWGKVSSTFSYKWWHCFPWKLVQGNQDVNSSHMFSRNIEITVFLCTRISLCVYYCFDVHYKFLLKGHKIVLKHHNPSCNNTLTVQKNCVTN